MNSSYANWAKTGSMIMFISIALNASVSFPTVCNKNVFANSTAFSERENIVTITTESGTIPASTISLYTLLAPYGSLLITYAVNSTVYDITSEGSPILRI